MHHTAIPTQPHSGAGIASFIISLAASTVLLIAMGIAEALESRPSGMNEESASAIMLGIVVILTALAQFAALGLGIAALVQAGRTKIFGVLGTVFAATGLVGTLMLLLLGALLEG